eukprot:scpid26394/ scgid7048/ 
MFRLLRSRGCIFSGVTQNIRFRATVRNEVPKVSTAPQQEDKHSGHDPSWSRDYVRLERLFEVRELNREQEFAMQAAGAEEPSPEVDEGGKVKDEAVQQLEDMAEQCREFESVCLDAHPEVLLDKLQTIRGKQLVPFTVELHSSRRLASLDSKSRARLLQALGMRLQRSDYQHVLSIMEDFATHLLKTASDFHRHEYLAAVFGLSSIRNLDCSALVSLMYERIQPEHVQTLSHQEFDWFCYIVRTYAKSAPHRLVQSIASHFKTSLNDLPPNILVQVAFATYHIQKKPFDARLLERLESRLASDFGSLSIQAQANIAQLFIEHRKHGYVPSKIDFGGVLLERMDRLKDWQLVMLARCLILSSQMTSEIMQAIIQFMKSMNRPQYFENLQTLSYFLTALLHRGFELPEKKELAELLAARVNPRLFVFSFRDAIFLMRCLLLLDAVRKKDLVSLFNYSVSGMKNWRVIDACTLLESLHLLQQKGWRGEYRRFSEFLLVHQNSFSPTPAPDIAVSVMITCNYIARMRWTRCTWLDVLVPYLVLNLQAMLNQTSTEMASHFFQHLANTGQNWSELFVPLCALIEQQGAETYFPMEHQRVRVLWACMLQDALPMQPMQLLLDNCSYSASLRKNDCLALCSQMEATALLLAGRPVSERLADRLITQHPFHRSHLKFVEHLTELLGPDRIRTQQVTREGLLAPVCIILDTVGCPVAWPKDNGNKSLSGSELKDAGFEPVVILPLGERDHSIDLKDVMAHVDCQMRLLEKTGWRAVLLSLPGLRVASATTNAKEARDFDARDKRVKHALKRKLEDSNISMPV